MSALERAREAWEKAGRPGAQPQLALFESTKFSERECVRGERKDRPRRRGRSSQS